jgi:hypothetical protein
LLFPDESTLERIEMNHTPEENAAAATKAIQLLRNSVYNDKLSNAGLFLAQLVVLEKQLPALLTPRLGDSLIRADGQPWLAELPGSSGSLQIDNLEQIAALPLNSHLRINPWTDQVVQLHLKPESLVSARDKMPLQVTPLFFRLSQYHPPTVQPPASNPAGASPSPSN